MNPETTRPTGDLYRLGADIPGGLETMQAVVPQAELPGQKLPYYLRNGAGERYLAGGLVVALKARGADTGGLFEWAVITGGKGAQLPAHHHETTHETLYVLNGEVELWLADQKHLLIRGDFASIPAGTRHALRTRSHHTQVVAMSSGDQMSALYRTLGTPYAGHVPPPDAASAPAAAALKAAEAASDVRFAGGVLSDAPGQRAERTELPKSEVPYVLAAGEGDRYLIGDQLFQVLCDNATTGGKLLVVGTEGPAGDMIVKHFHREHSEAFFCVDGRMRMWANQSLVDVEPGDFVAIPAGTIHAYQFKSPFTRMVGLLTPGIFEQFFRSAQPYAGHVYPQQPGPGPNFAVVSKLDLFLTERPGPPSTPN